MAYTVKELAEISGVSVRTLHFYDEIGLLKPAFVGANGYRYYGEEELLLLQQILFYRELEFELKEIQRILSRHDLNKVRALKEHRKVLLQRHERTRQLIETIDKTIKRLSEGKKMKANEMFVGFDPKKQAEHEEFLIERFGESAREGIAESKRKIKDWRKADWEKSQREWDSICRDLVRLRKEGRSAGSPETLEVVRRHYHWLERFWTPNKESYAGHGQFIVETELGKAYAAYHPDLPQYIASGIQAFAVRELS